MEEKSIIQLIKEKDETGEYQRPKILTYKLIPENTGLENIDIKVSKISSYVVDGGKISETMSQYDNMDEASVVSIMRMCAQHIFPDLKSSQGLERIELYEVDTMTGKNYHILIEPLNVFMYAKNK